MRAIFLGIFKAILLVSLIVLDAGCSIVRGESSPAQYSNDAAITAQIKTKFMQSDIVPFTKVSVETKNGVVQLSGFVSNPAQAQQAQQIAASVSGVKNVQNNLIVEPATRH